MAGIGLGDDHRCLSARGTADRVGLIVSMVGVERHRQVRLARLPLGSFTDRSVGDLAQRAMSSTETGADPIGEFAAQGAVGVVYAHQAHDLPGRCRVRGTHRDSIADRVPISATVSPAVPFFVLNRGRCNRSCS